MMFMIKKICKIIFDIIVYFLIIVLSLYLCLVFYQKIFQKSELLSFGNYYIFRIASSSMETNLHVGDYIIVKKTNNYKVGDIITFKEDGVYITHRIYSIDGDNIVTKGDANLTIDGSIEKDNILGKVLFKLFILTFAVKYKYIIIALIISLFILDIVLKKENEEEVLE